MRERLNYSSIVLPKDKSNVERDMTEIEVSIWAAILTLSFLLIIWALCCRNIENQSTDRVRFSSPNMLSTFAGHCEKDEP